MRIVFFALAAAIFLVACGETNQGGKLPPKLQKYASEVINESDKITDTRKIALEEIAYYISGKIAKDEDVKLVFICTHNSRRSQMAQIWAQTAAEMHEIPKFMAYSGGTEATAFNPRAVKAIKKAGFEVTEKSTGDNPIYAVKYTTGGDKIEAFSKKYTDESVPKENFAAVMVCSHADSNCPFVPGAEDRISLPFDDPKEFDGSDQEETKYDERCRVIAREIFYIFEKVKLK